MRAVGIIGTGQSAFTKSRSDVTYPELVREGVELALADAGVTMADVGAVVFPLAPDALIGVGNGERWCVEALGAQGKPFMRVNTGGATGLTAVVAGDLHVASGLFDVVLVAGADRVLESRSAQSVLNKMWDVAYERPFPLNTITMLALAAQRYNAKYGSDERDLARVTVKNRRHAALNPHAHLRTPITEDEVLATRMISWPLKLADLCPSSTGAGEGSRGRAALALPPRRICRGGLAGQGNRHLHRRRRREHLHPGACHRHRLRPGQGPGRGTGTAISSSTRPPGTSTRWRQWPAGSPSPRSSTSSKLASSTRTRFTCSACSSSGSWP